MIGDNADTSTGMGAIGRMQVVVRCERVSHLYLCTPERQSLCESHRQRRWLTHWSYADRLLQQRAPLCEAPLERIGIAHARQDRSQEALVAAGTTEGQAPDEPPNRMLHVPLVKV